MVFVCVTIEGRAGEKGHNMDRTYGIINCEACGADHKTTQPKLGPPKLQTCEKCNHKWHPQMMT